MSLTLVSDPVISFNPCFNGFMDKWPTLRPSLPSGARVSTLVLMDSWINGDLIRHRGYRAKSFNPCFNGFMDKW